MARLGGWTVDLGADLVRLSDEACAIARVPNGTTFSVQGWVDSCTPDTAPMIASAFAACARRGTPFELELEMVAKGHRVPIPVRVRGEAIRGATGRIEQIQGALQDISTLREAQAKRDRLDVILAQTLETITDAFYTLDLDWRFTYLNREAERIQRRTRAQLLGRVVWEVFPEAVGTVFDTEFHRAMATGETVIFESHYAPLDLWVAVRAYPSADGLAVYFLDINARHEAELSLAASERRYRAVFEESGDAILISDDAGRYVDANPAAASLLGVERDAIIGRGPQDFAADSLGDADTGAAWQAFRAAGRLRGEVRFRRPDGRISVAEMSAIADISPGLHFGTFRDITERRQHERMAHERANILDALRRLDPDDDPEATANAICVEIAGNGDFPSAAIYDFGAEDRSAAIGAHLRDGRGVAGLPPVPAHRVRDLETRASRGPWVDDFTGAGDARWRARFASLGVRSVAFAPIVFDGRLIGLLAAGADASRAELLPRVPALVEFAALASSLLGPGLRRRSQRAAERARVRDVIETQAYSTVFQPIVEMTSGQVLGYEALTRFDDGTPPDRVFREASDAGMGIDLKCATIEAALAASAPLPTGTFLDINVSPDMVLAGEPLHSLLRRSRTRVVLEITEHVGVDDYGALRKALADLGTDVRFAVDDAGAGFASLRHILELAPSHVKLDRALVTRIDTDPARQALVAGLVHFAGEIGAMLIAEGVETRGERDTLLRLGVQVGQGYLLGRPAPAEPAVRKGAKPVPVSRATASRSRRRST